MKGTYFNPMKGQENLMRAMEIAIHTPDCKILLLPGDGTSNEQIDAYNALIDNIPTFQPLECTLLPQPEKSMLIEVLNPDIGRLLSARQSTDLADLSTKVDTEADVIKERRTNIIEAQTIKEVFCMNESCNALLTTAYVRLGLQPYEVEFIIDMAVTIAALDMSKKIEAQHIAEAIQYRSVEKTFLNQYLKEITRP